MGRSAALREIAPGVPAPPPRLRRTAPGGDSILPERIVGPNTDVIEVADEILRFVAKYARTDAPPLR